MNIPVFDFHCDSSWKLWKDDFTKHDSLYENENHIDLKRGQKLSGYAQCFACFTTIRDSSYPAAAKEIFEKEIQVIRSAVEQYGDILSFAFSVA